MHILPIVTKLRTNGIRSEIYPDSAKMKKQMTYADNNHIPFVAMIGENEIEENKVMLKNMKSGEQKAYATDELIATLIDATKK